MEPEQARTDMRRPSHRTEFGPWFRVAFALTIALLAALPAAAAERGPVTNLPLPRFVSLKAAEGNVRRGPSLSHRIDWVLTRRNMPLRVTAEHGHWRRVEDRDGLGGWVHYSLISGNRTVIVERDMLTLHARPDAATPVVAALEAGVIAELGRCETEFCRLSAGGYRGWARRSALWGIGRDELRD
jgi:SH3-like domain-containing protein